MLTQHHHIVGKHRVFALRADGLALDGFDPDPIPLRINEIQRRHYVLRTRNS